jgi:UDP-N-acetylmuramoyl-tripeptide--D-alanyl-D-alanine ligase
MMTLTDVLECFSGKRFQSLAATRVSSVVLDSNIVEKNGLFVALQGARVDGADFARAAIENGAAAVIIDVNKVAKLGGLAIPVLKPDAWSLTPDALSPPVAIAVENPEVALQQLATYWRKAQRALRVIGVTGSIGKTTTKELIAQVLSIKFNVLKSAGTQNNALGVPLTLLKLTPEHDYAVLEMGMDRLGEISGYCVWALPQIGVVTNVGPVHMERLGSLENIARAKAELPQALPAAAQGGVAVLNDDDEWVSAMTTQTQARVVTYGLTQRAEVWASDIESHGLSGVSFVLHHGSHRAFVHMKLLGRHSVHTALRAAAVAIAEGLSLEEIVEGLIADPSQLRLVVASGPHDSLVLDDTYNASPESTIAALNLLNDINGKTPRIAVLGDMFELGDAEQIGHEEVGCRAASVAGRIICVGERSRHTARAAVECGAKRDRVHHVMTNGEAIALLETLVTEKSIILIKGSRGMKMEEIVTALGGGADD